MRRELVSLLGLAAVACSGGKSDAPPPAAAASSGPKGAYVGRDACRRCHQDIFASYARTGMGRSWYPLTPATAVEDFTRNNVLVLPESGIVYTMRERDGRYFMRQAVRDGRGEERAADEREMVEVAGSGNHSRSYVTVVDGKRFQLPVCWYPKVEAWDLCPGYELRNDYFSRAITASCVFCHNARMELEPGTRNVFREPVPHGIDCERCHGPGGEHVEVRSAERGAPSGEADPTIVNPRRLRGAARLGVCFQCHLGDSSATERVSRFDRTFESFRPGEPVTVAMIPFAYEEPLGARFGVSAQADRLVRSRCFRESGGKLDCLACHDPHVSVYDASRPPDLFRKACLACHAVAECPHGQGDCVPCHMRRAGPQDHPHAEFTDHWIRRDPSKEGDPARRSLALAPVFPEAFAALPERERDLYAGRAAILKSTDVPPRARPAMWADAERSLREAIRAGEDSAEAHFELGRVLARLRRGAEARAELEATLVRDPANDEASLLLGQILVAEGKLDDAERVFADGLARRPESAGLLAESARCRAMRQDAAGALALYDRAAAIEPWKASLHANRAWLLAVSGRLPEALEASAAAVRAAPGDADLWEMRAKILAGAGKTADAEAAAAIRDRLRKVGAPEFAPRGMMGSGG